MLNMIWTNGMFGVGSGVGGFAESLKIFYTRWVCTDELTHGYGGIVIGYK